MKKNVLFLLLLFSFTSLSAEETCESFFTKIYDNALWGEHEGCCRSGEGSKVTVAAPYMRLLQDFLRNNAIKSVVDVGCGDWNFSKEMNWTGIQYTGVDVVKSVIATNKEKFKAPNLSFIHADATLEGVPSADLLICKDVLQHLNNEMIQAFLKKISSYKYCLITNDVDAATLSSSNTDRVNDYHTVDLSRPPFNIKGVKLLHYSSGYVIKQVFCIVN